jgi:predicted secreted protein
MAANLFAGDYAELKILGFSADGRYLAFEEAGEWDVHSGGDYATTYFVDVAKNIYAAAPSVYSFSENDERHTGRFSQAAQMRRYKLSVAAGMKRFKIVRGNLGRLVAAHLETDHSFEKPVMKETEIAQSDGSVIKKMMPFYEGDSLLPEEYNANKIIFNPLNYPVNPADEKFYELELKQNPSGKSCEVRGVEADASMIELTLQEIDHYSESPLRILQKDNFLPEARNCPYAYNIEQVYLNKDNLAVFLDVYTMGFPGSTRRYMVVTGTLDDEGVE